jgi:hypothetical protein
VNEYKNIRVHGVEAHGQKYIKAHLFNTRVLYVKSIVIFRLYKVMNCMTYHEIIIIGLIWMIIT